MKKIHSFQSVQGTALQLGESHPEQLSQMSTVCHFLCINIHEKLPCIVQKCLSEDKMEVVGKFANQPHSGKMRFNMNLLAL